LIRAVHFSRVPFVMRDRVTSPADSRKTASSCSGYGKCTLEEMKPKAPVVDLLIIRDGDAWRLLFAPMSWVPGSLRTRVDGRRELFPVKQPDAEDLERFMFDADAPYDRRPTRDGGLELLARGRSAVCLLVWLEELAA
jgi:hypothetical protein